MSTQSRGIIFQQVKYNDKSLIVKIYLEETGLQSFLVKGATNRSSRFKPAHFQPLSLVELVYNHRANKDLQFLNDLMIHVHFTSLYTNMQKSAMILFMNELLIKTVKEHEANPSLFEYLFQSIQWLDLVQEDFLDFHLYFAIELSRHLGFYPKIDELGKNQVFDLIEGIFKAEFPSHQYYIGLPFSEYFALLCKPNQQTPGQFGFDNHIRRMLLQQIILFYSLHIPGFNDMKSPDVLRMVMG
ncbi:MAG: DNA repair protein RecO [Bacteroidales bacterium]|nr:DNA repair protein RecO [Bacteroidales bacterium]